MGGKSIHLRLPEKLHEELQKIKECSGFSNIQDFLRDLSRKAVNYYKKKGNLL